jgi:[NiFe] hydrogenase diaphorase moiety large subunit
VAQRSSLPQVVNEAADRVGRDRTRLLDVAREVQARQRCVSSEAMRLIAQALKAPIVDVEALVSFYAFLSREPLGEHVIRLSECPACRGAGGRKTAAALEEALGIRMGQTTADGRFSLLQTSCIGLCDQGPAALVDMRPVPGLSAARVPELLRALNEGPLSPGQFPVLEQVRKKDQIILGERQTGAGLRRAISMAPLDVIAEMKSSRLRGRGGAGFPTGSKWELAQRAGGTRKVIVCNADEGEPGTFKDRVIFSSNPGLVLEGMAIAGWAVGASQGIIYLRGEYEFLLEQLLAAIESARRSGFLGRDILGHSGFDFDVRVQLGAGAYVCGEESALISSLEGRYGVPKDRPPFPVERGYLGLPTVVNNVETLCCAARIAEKGVDWFTGFGLGESTGTKLLSVSGDCERPGIYEMPLGVPVRDFLAEVGGARAQALLVGGPSGSFVGPAEFGRELGFHDLPTGGSMMVFGPERDLLEVASEFMHFFVEESCGWCTPCRVGNVLLKERLDRIRAGKGVPEDLGYLEELCQTVKKMSRCGLGQTSPNPVQSTLSHFRPLYEARLRGPAGPLLPSFDLDASVAEAARLRGSASAPRRD